MTKNREFSAYHKEKLFLVLKYVIAALTLQMSKEILVSTFMTGLIWLLCLFYQHIFRKTVLILASIKWKWCWKAIQNVIVCSVYASVHICMWGRHGRDRMVVYNYLCNQYLSPLILWVRIPLRGGVLDDTTLCDKVCEWLATGWWFSSGTPVSSATI